MSLPERPRAVVTGAGSGLGRALCLELARRQARVVVSDVPGNTVRCTNVIEDGAVVRNDDFEACINGGEGPMVEYASCADGEDAATPQYDGQRYLIHVGSEPVEYSPPDPDC